jgi:hypothetical protein
MKTTTLTVHVGPKLFMFTSFAHWACTFHWKYRESGYDKDRTVCIDATGRIVAGIGDFQKASVRGAFPVSVHVLLDSRKHSEGHYEGTWRAANVGVRTDWNLIGEEAREQWRDEIDNGREVGNG